MSQEVIAALGAGCPNQGSFFVCEDKPTRFVGCCTVDPCKTNNGICPDDSLRAASFDRYSSNQFRPQECVSERPEVQWFTCADLEVPFMGCCSVNPCSGDRGCPARNLKAARLSDDDEQAAIFLPEGGGSDLPTGATVGIGVGAAVGVCIIIGGLVWWVFRRRRHARQREASSTYEPYANDPAHKQSPYASTFAGSIMSPTLPQQHKPPYGHTQHQHQISWDASQGGFSYQSPASQQNAFVGSPYLGAGGQQDYAHLPQQQQQEPAPIQELGGAAVVPELATTSQNESVVDNQNSKQGGKEVR